MAAIGEKNHFDRKFLIGAVGLLAVFFYFVACALDRGSWHFLDGVDLVIHEAGHVIFMFFGEFVSFAGGTIIQIVLPLIFASYFFLRHKFVSASAVSFWLGQNLTNISVYVADAETMALPLLGGGIHDWNYMLGETGLLMQAPRIAAAFYSLGMFVYCLALAVGFYGLYDDLCKRILDKENNN